MVSSASAPSRSLVVGTPVAAPMGAALALHGLTPDDGSCCFLRSALGVLCWITHCNPSNQVVLGDTCSVPDGVKPMSRWKFSLTPSPQTSRGLWVDDRDPC